MPLKTKVRTKPSVGLPWCVDLVLWNPEHNENLPWALPHGEQPCPSPCVRWLLNQPNVIKMDLMPPDQNNLEHYYRQAATLAGSPSLSYREDLRVPLHCHGPKLHVHGSIHEVTHSHTECPARRLKEWTAFSPEQTCARPGQAHFTVLIS